MFGPSISGCLSKIASMVNLPAPFRVEVVKRI
ncbi:hypothetical protein Tco_0607442, partial [Tanacetum coccineum]